MYKHMQLSKSFLCQTDCFVFIHHMKIYENCHALKMFIIAIKTKNHFFQNTNHQLYQQIAHCHRRHMYAHNTRILDMWASFRSVPPSSFFSATLQDTIQFKTPFGGPPKQLLQLFCGRVLFRVKSFQPPMLTKRTSCTVIPFCLYL